MNDLPRVSAFLINEQLDNSQERYYGNSEDKYFSNKKDSVITKINNIFASNNHVYKSRVRIKTKNDILEKVIVGKTNTLLLTITGEKIAIIDILDIEKL